jgi:hypothetical protein
MREHAGDVTSRAPQLLPEYGQRAVLEDNLAAPSFLSVSCQWHIERDGR